MNTTYLDSLVNVCGTEDAANLTSGERLLAVAYVYSMREGYDVIAVNEIIWEQDVETFVEAIQKAEIDEIYMTTQASNMLNVYLMLDEMGLKLRGVVRLENPRHAEDAEKYGYSYEPATVAAMKFSFE